MSAQNLYMNRSLLVIAQNWKKNHSAIKKNKSETHTNPKDVKDYAKNKKVNRKRPHTV